MKVLLPNYWTTKEVPEKIFLSFSFLWELKGIQLVADSEGKGRESQSLHTDRLSRKCVESLASESDDTGLSGVVFLPCGRQPEGRF